jgi:hypothetical protein
MSICDTAVFVTVEEIRGRQLMEIQKVHLKSRPAAMRIHRVRDGTAKADTEKAEDNPSACAVEVHDTLSDFGRH